MYQVTTSEAAKYLTSDFIPISDDSTVSAAAVDGKIESIKVTSGTGYTNGTYYAAIYGDGTSVDNLVPSLSLRRSVCVLSIPVYA